MKKILEKIVSISLAFIALLFVILMLVIMFKPEYAVNLDNSFVHVLMLIFTGIFVTLSVINIASAFSDSEKINSVLLFKAKSSATKATLAVVNKTARQATKLVEGAKLKKVTLFADENNDLKIRLDLKIESSDVETTVNAVRATVMTTFSGVLGLDFANIDFKLLKVKNEFKPEKADVDKKIAEFKKEIEVEKELKRKEIEENEEVVSETEEEKEEITAAEITEEADEVVASEELVEEIAAEEAVSEEAINEDEEAINDVESTEPNADIDEELIEEVELKE